LYGKKKDNRKRNKSIKPTIVKKPKKSMGETNKQNKN
jgi:hypothetical protein